MTEREILDRQEQGGNQEFLLVLVGKFYHAYGHGAFALARATGYRVVRKQRKGGDVAVCGFPADRLEQVRLCVAAQGGELREQQAAGAWTLSGLDGTPDEAMVSSAKAAPAAGTAAPVPAARPADWLSSAVRSFNLSLSTPLDAMQFISSLQQELHATES